MFQLWRTLWHSQQLLGLLLSLLHLYKSLLTQFRTAVCCIYSAVSFAKFKRLIKDINIRCRYMFGLAAIPSVIQTIGFLFMPDTPRWLVARGRLDKARAVLHRIHGSSIDVDQEIANINNSIQQSAENRKLPCRLCIKVLFLLKLELFHRLPKDLWGIA